MTEDEAAAIQLYTQHSCLYPMLNSTLRDHSQPEHLKAFLPYLKLLLRSLNKLPLRRAKVYRGMSGDLHEEYNRLQGRKFCWWFSAKKNFFLTKAQKAKLEEKERLEEEAEKKR